MSELPIPPHVPQRPVAEYACEPSDTLLTELRDRERVLRAGLNHTMARLNLSQLDLTSFQIDTGSTKVYMTRMAAGAVIRRES